MGQLFASAEDFAYLLASDAERYDLHYPPYRYFQRYYVNAQGGSTGTTSASATRQFRWVGGDFTLYRIGTRLRVLTGDDKGEYEIVEVGSLDDSELVTVNRDWPVGGQAGLTFVVEMSDLYGDSLPRLVDTFLERPTRVPICLVLEAPTQLLEKFDFDEQATGVIEFSRGLQEDAPHEFVPVIGDLLEGPDGAVYEIVNVKPWDYVGATGHFLHWVGLVNRTHRTLPGSFNLGEIAPGAPEIVSYYNQGMPEVVPYTVQANQTVFVLPYVGVKSDRDGTKLIEMTYNGVGQELGVDFILDDDETQFTWISDVPIDTGDKLILRYYPR